MIGTILQNLATVIGYVGSSMLQLGMNEYAWFNTRIFFNFSTLQIKVHLCNYYIKVNFTAN